MGETGEGSTMHWIVLPPSPPVLDLPLSSSTYPYLPSTPPPRKCVVAPRVINSLLTPPLPRSFLLFFGEARGVSMIVEQPLNSLLYHMPEFQDTLAMLSSCRVVTCLGAFGSDTAKPIEVHSTLGAIVTIKRTRKHAHIRMGKSRKTTHFNSDVAPTSRARAVAKRANGWPTLQWVNGKAKLLKSSQTYPRDYCALIAELVSASIVSI